LHDTRFRAGDAFLLGPETRGLPAGILDALPAEARLRIPLRPGNRSLNVSNAAAIVLYEAWRQTGFDGGA
jgi:tRNA (cytidine/uridine-2'-O-)-methyltransferase